MTNHAYTDSDDDIAAAYTRIHANDEQTQVYILSAGDEWYVSVAVDVDPVEGDPGPAETITYAPTIDAAHKRTERWLETHSRGVGASDESDGLLAKIWGAVQNLDQSDTEETDTNV